MVHTFWWCNKNLPTTVHLAQMDGPGEFFICRNSDDKEVISEIFFEILRPVGSHDIYYRVFSIEYEKWFSRCEEIFNHLM